MGKRALLGVLIGMSIALHGLVARAESVREAIDAGNGAFVAAFLRGDAQAISLIYTEDAEVIAPGAPAARGRAAIAAAWQSSIDSGIKNVSLHTAEVEASGDLACETGTVRLVDKDGKVGEGRYVVVWKRAGGAWKMYRDIWNAE